MRDDEKLQKILRVEEEMLRFKRFIDSKTAESKLPGKDPEQTSIIQNVLEDSYIHISELFASLAINKAKLGIVGKTWYKEEDDENT